MAHGKDDSWKYDGIERRDFRHTHGEPEAPRHKAKKKKNTKKWCKGKVGQEHDFSEWNTSKYGSIVKIEVCSRCGKHGRYFWIKDSSRLRRN